MKTIKTPFPRPKWMIKQWNTWSNKAPRHAAFHSVRPSCHVQKELSPRPFPTRNKQTLSVSNLSKLPKVKARLYFWAKNIMFLIFREYHLDFAIPYAHKWKAFV